MVLGIISFSVLLLYYVQETSYDDHFPNAENIYRITINSTEDGSYQESARSPIPFLDFYHEAVGSELVLARMIPWPGYLKYQANQKSKENQFVFADPEILDIFPMEVRQGSLENSLQAPFQLIITQSKALQYFGEQNPIGQTLSFDEGSDELSFTVTAVIEDNPFNTHLDFDFIASIKSLDQFAPWYYSWFYPTAFLYARLEPEANLSSLEKVAQDVLNTNAKPGYLDSNPEIVFQPLTDIHLQSNRQGEWKPNNTQININLFLLLGMFILLIAIINYVNLTTANNQKRMKEIGLKKTMGSKRDQLIQQFFVESWLIIAISFVLSVLILLIIWDPLISKLIDGNTISELLVNYQLTIWVLLGLIVTSGLAGFYPTLVTIKFNPIDAIKNNIGKYMNKGIQRKTLVSTQFSISMILILITMLLIQQYHYLTSKNPGFSKDYHVAIKMADDHDIQHVKELKAQLSQLSFIQNTAASSAILGLSESFHGFDVKFPDRPNFQGIEWPTLGVDEDFLKTFDIKLASGRDFSKDYITDQSEAFIINRSAADHLGGELLGENIELSIYTGKREIRKGKIIGIVEDFHFKSFYQSVDPLVIYINQHPNFTDFLNIKLSPGSMADQIEAIESVYKAFNTDKPMELLFINDEIASTYQRELASGKIMLLFTVLSIFVAALGAFGLATHSFRRRSKEMGIRKVLGASSGNITLEVLKEYLIIVSIACISAWPLVYYLSSKWLDNFAYATDFGFVNYLIGLLILILVIVISNLHQLIRSIKLNPVEYLKDE